MATLVRWGRRRLAWGVIGLIISLMGAFVVTHGYTTPRYDEWWVLHPLVIAAVDGQYPTLEMLARSVSGHRHVIPNLVGLWAALATNYTSPLLLVISNFVVLIAAFVLVVLTYRQTGLPDGRGWVYVLFALLLFAPVQAFNLLFGFQRCIWYMMLAGYLAMYAVARWGTKWQAWLIGLAAALLASWSFFGGNALWLIVPIGMAFKGERRWRAYGLWGLALIMHLLLFLNGYELVQPEPQQNTLLHILVWNPLAALGGLFVNVPLTYDFGPIGYLAAVAGAIGVGLLIVALINAARLPGFQWSRLAPYFMGILFTAALVAQVTLGRNSIAFHSLVSRFTTFVVPFWIGLIAILVAVRGQMRGRRAIYRMTLLSMTALMLLAVAYVLVSWRYLDVQADPVEAERCFLAMESNECLIMIYGTDTYITVADMSRLIDELRTRRLSLFSQAP